MAFLANHPESRLVTIMLASVITSKAANGYQS